MAEITIHTNNDKVYNDILELFEKLDNTYCIDHDEMNESIHKLLKEAFETHKKEGWVALSRASSYIKDKQPDFSLKEYYSKFYKLIQDFPEKYKLEKSHTKYQCK